MDCVHAQELILAMETPGRIEAMVPELRRHVESCPACTALAATMVRLEALVPTLPVPDSAAAKARLQQRLRTTPRSPVHSYRFVTPQRLAVAAGLLLIVGLTVSAVLFLTRRADASSELVAQLVDWNVDMAQTPNLKDRSRLFREKAALFSKRLAQGGASGEESALAKALFDQVSWLAEHDDPLAAADRFCSLTELFAKQSQREANVKDYGTSARHLGECQRIRRAGVEANLARVGSQAHTSEQKERLDSVRRRDKATAAEMARLADHPDIGEHLKVYRQQHPCDKDDADSKSDSKH